MKLDKSLLTDTTETHQLLMDILVKHFDYSMREVNNYDFLTAEEQSIIDRDQWNAMMVPNDSEE